jgi:hypothetical protein
LVFDFLVFLFYSIFMNDQYHVRTPEMSIATENLPLSHRRHLEKLIPRRCRAAMLRKAKPTALLPRRVQIQSYRAAAAPRLIYKKSTAAAPLPRRHQ